MIQVDSSITLFHAEHRLTSEASATLRLTESYERVFEVDQESAPAAASTTERFVDFTLTNPMVAPAFEDNVRQLAQLSKQHAPGVISVRLRRSMGITT